MAERNNELDAFDQHVRGSLEQFEVPYNSADWTQLERALNGERRGWWLSGAGLAAMLISGALVVGTAAYVLSTNGHSSEELNVAGLGTTTKATNDAKGQEMKPAAPATLAPTDTETKSSNSGATPDGGKPNGAANSAALPTATAPTTDLTKNTHNNANSAAITGTKAALVPAAKATTPAVPERNTIAGAAPSANAEPTFHASISEGCPGAPIHFKVEHMPEDGIYLWNFGDGSFSNKANPEHTFTKPGSYQVMLSMSATGVGTIHNKPSSDVIVIHESPKAAFNVLKQEYDGHIPSVHFENRTMGGSTYDWSFGDGATSDIAHPDHIFKKKGIYQVELTTTNEIGCVDKTLHEVRIEKDYNLDAPASFSPDGDGTNEAFIPEALRQLGVKFHLAVYDSNGGLVYETNDATKPWTGRPNNRGEVLPAGEYVWVVDVRESLHLAETYTGKVQLVR